MRDARWSADLVQVLAAADCETWEWVIGFEDGLRKNLAG